MQYNNPCTNDESAISLSLFANETVMFESILWLIDEDLVLSNHGALEINFN
jgi:hypothetical protein